MRPKEYPCYTTIALILSECYCTVSPVTGSTTSAPNSMSITGCHWLCTLYLDPNVTSVGCNTLLTFETDCQGTTLCDDRSETACCSICCRAIYKSATLHNHKQGVYPLWETVCCRCKRCCWTVLLEKWEPESQRAREPESQRARHCWQVLPVMPPYRAPHVGLAPRMQLAPVVQGRTVFCRFRYKSKFQLE